MCLHQIQPWGKATLAPASSHSADRVALQCYLCVTPSQYSVLKSQGEREKPVNLLR